jgi:hypothetical protein
MARLPEFQYWTRQQVLSRPGWRDAKITDVGQLKFDLVQDGAGYYLRSRVREWERTRIAHLRRRHIQQRWDARRRSRTSSGLLELDAALATLREKEIAERSEEAERRAGLSTKWAEIEPSIALAIDQVNKILSKHGYARGIVIERPRFNEPEADAYGATCRILDIRAGEFQIVLCGNELYVNHVYGSRWREGYKAPAKVAAVAPLARAIAETARWLITEPPS